MHQAARLTEILEDNRIAVQRFDGAPDVDLPKLEEFALEVVSRLEPSADHLVLNLTGGTKLMAIGFFQVLRSEVHRCIYTDTAHGRMELLPISAARASPQPLASVLEVPTYLLAQGFRARHIASGEPDGLQGLRDRKPVAKQLGRSASDLGGFIGALNVLASAAMDGEQLSQPEQSFRETPRGGWVKALTAPWRQAPSPGAE